MISLDVVSRLRLALSKLKKGELYNSRMGRQVLKVSHHMLLDWGVPILLWLYTVGSFMLDDTAWDRDYVGANY